MTLPSGIPLLVAIEHRGCCLEVYAGPGGSWVLGERELAARTQLVRAHAQASTLVGGKSWFSNDLPDPETMRAEALDSAIALWDYEHIFQPLICGAERHPLTIIYPGNSPLPRLSLRMSLRAAFLVGLLGPAAYTAIACIPYWQARGLERLLALLAAGCALPPVRARDVTMLIAPPPATGIEGLYASGRLGPASVHALALEHGDQLRQLEQTRFVQKTLVTNARAMGAQVVCPATSRDLYEALRSPCEGKTLVLVAHQDDRGLAFEDQSVPLNAARVMLLDAWPACHDSVLLSVCGAGALGNLAECFQAAGSYSVITFGKVAFYGRTLAYLTCFFDQLGETGPAPLHHIVDRTWFELARASIRDP